MEQKSPITLAGLEKFSGAKIAVAVSGGLDSCVLLHLLSLEKENFSELRIVHVNYGLRDIESDQDALFVAELARQYGLSLDLRTVTNEERSMRRGEGIQEWARRLRYEVFRNLANQGFVITLGHHQDDVAENVIMRLARGCSAGNLAGMRVVRGAYWRPLLLQPKALLGSIAQERGLRHREDSSNAKIMYSRNFVRHEVLAKLETVFPGALQRIAATGLDAQEVRDYTRHQLLGNLDAGRAQSILINDLLRLDLGVALETLSAFLQSKSTTAVYLHRRFLTGIVDDLKTRETKPFLKRYLKNGWEIFVRGDQLVVNTETEKSKNLKNKFGTEEARESL